MISEAHLKKRVTGQNVLIDSNIIIYLTDSVDPYLNLAKHLFAIVEAGDATAVISILSVGEVMQGPIRQGEYDLAMRVKEYLINFPNCQCQEVTGTVLDRVGNDERIEWDGLRVVDSLIIASGLITGVDLFVSNDKHFQKAIPESMMLTLE